MTGKAQPQRPNMNHKSPPNRRKTNTNNNSNNNDNSNNSNDEEDNNNNNKNNNDNNNEQMMHNENKNDTEDTDTDTDTGTGTDTDNSDESANESESDINRECWIIVDNIPHLRKSTDFQEYGIALEEAAQQCATTRVKPIVFIPHKAETDRYGSTETTIFGCAFIHFDQPAGAQAFYHTYANIDLLIKQFGPIDVYLWADYLELDALSDAYTKLSKREFQENNNMYWWLLDAKKPWAMRDQFVIRYKGQSYQETAVFWNDENVPLGRDMCYDQRNLKKLGKVMTTSWVKWSPSGRYLVTFHTNGIQLWGGPLWKSMLKVNHRFVDKIAFTPNETKLITCNSSTHANVKPEMKVWDLASRSHEPWLAVPHSKIGPVIKLKLPGWWPVLQFSYNDEYFVKIASSKGMSAKAKDLDKMQIYLSATKRRLGGGSVHAAGLFNVAFSPADNLLAYTCQAQLNDPATISLVKLPSLQTQRVQTLGFDVRMAHLYWQSQGRYVAIRIAHKFPKTFHIKEHSIGIICVKQNQMPYSRISKFGKISFFAWEPNSNRFGVIHSVKEPDMPPMIFVSVYRVNPDGTPHRLWKIERRRPNLLSWSPFGCRLAVAFLDPHKANGEIEFFDLNAAGSGSAAKRRSQPLGVKRPHDAMTEIHWCPSGRYVITAATQEMNTQASGDDTGYIVWNFQGEKLFDIKLRFFFQFYWRPRCPRQLTLNKNEKQAAKAMSKKKEWVKKFRLSDMRTKHEKLGKKIRMYVSLRESFALFQKDIQQKSESILQQRAILQRSMNDESEYESRQKVVEVVKQKTEVYVDKETMKRIMNGENVKFD